jgi:hypothetical protein
MHKFDTRIPAEQLVQVDPSMQVKQSVGQPKQ